MLRWDERWCWLLVWHKACETATPHNQARLAVRLSDEIIMLGLIIL